MADSTQIWRSLRGSGQTHWRLKNSAKALCSPLTSGENILALTARSLFQRPYKDPEVPKLPKQATDVILRLLDIQADFMVATTPVEGFRYRTPDELIGEYLGCVIKAPDHPLSKLTANEIGALPIEDTFPKLESELAGVASMRELWEPGSHQSREDKLAMSRVEFAYAFAQGAVCRLMAHMQARDAIRKASAFARSVME